jgi:hypothetical protein
MVGLGPVAALCMYLTGHVDGYKRSSRQLDGLGQMKLGCLVSSAFVEAVEQRVPCQKSCGAVDQGICAGRSCSPGSCI